MKRVLVFAAVSEAATGVALLIVPSLVGQLLFGVELSGIAIPVARVLGIALIALGIACWLARKTPTAPASVGVAWAYAIFVTLQGGITLLTAIGAAMLTMAPSIITTGQPFAFALAGGEAAWLVLDYFDVIVHVMRTDLRERYDLEGLWGDAPRVRARRKPAEAV